MGAVRVTPTWNGGGTVLCTILDSLYNPASSVLIDTVQQIIDPTRDGNGVGLAPIGHVVTIDTPNPVTVNITVTIEFEQGYDWENTHEAIEQTMSDYMLELRQAWGSSSNTTIVRVSQIETRLLQIHGIVDVSAVKINGITSNLIVPAHDVPVMGVIAQNDPNG